MKFGVIRFPGSNCDQDAYYVVKDVLHKPVEYLWHQDRSTKGFDCLILPGGFSYGDYLRTGAIARFSPIMDAVRNHAELGRPVIGICNGFQVLCEAGLLPGALVRNVGLKFRCETVRVRIETNQSPWLSGAKAGQVLRIPIAHGEGCYVADPETIYELNSEGRIAFRYVDAKGTPTILGNPNGSIDNIAGILNRGHNVLGMMPHPERASEKLLGSSDGRILFDSIVRHLLVG